MKFPAIRSAEELADLVEEIGFLPFFRGEIGGFSVEECTPRELWFTDEEGPWEWKGPVIRRTGSAYGKFYAGKAMYIARRFFPAFANFRRDGYDYDARVDEGLARRRDLAVMQALSEAPSLLSKELKRRACASEESRKRFDSTLTFLQMQGYVVISDFEYAADRFGKPYGWGLARYATPEAAFGERFRAEAYAETPAQSYAKLEGYLQTLLPQAGLTQIGRLLAGK